MILSNKFHRNKIMENGEKYSSNWFDYLYECPLLKQQVMRNQFIPRSLFSYDDLYLEVDVNQ